MLEKCGSMENSDWRYSKEEVKRAMSGMKVTFKHPDEILEFVNTVSRYDFDMDMR